MSSKVLILACGALARELNDIVALNDFGHVTIECLPGDLHNHPEKIPPAIEARLDAVEGRFEEILLGYGDCGTGGRIDEICRRRGVSRLPGPHCYEFYTGRDRFAALHAQELGTLYLTDYLAKFFDLFIWELLGIDKHPELRDMYFGNYRRVVHLAQTDDPAIRAKAEEAAARLELDFEYLHTGYGEMAGVVVELGAATR